MSNKNLPIKFGFLQSQIIILLAFFLFIFAHKAAAGTSSCQIVYGGGKICPENTSFSIESLIQVPGSKQENFINNMSGNDPKYKPLQNAVFKIKISNTGADKIKRLEIVNTLPEFVDFVLGPGNFDKEKKTLTFEALDIDPGQTREFLIAGRTSEEKFFPANQSVACGTNYAKAVEENSITAESSSQVCIEKDTSVKGEKTGPVVYPPVSVQTTPKAGNKTIYAIGLLLILAAGIIISKKSQSRASKTR